MNSSPATPTGTGRSARSSRWIVVFATGRPIGTVGLGPRSQAHQVTSTAASVGPYRFSSAAPERARNRSLRSRESASPLAITRASGEALSRDLKDRFLARTGAALENLYGPTEAAVDVTWWACERGPRPTVPIGRPVANTTIHLLDRALRPVPVGVAGELFIGGVQVGRGYWRRPELTAERFVPDPFSVVPGARLYRTGDLARYAPDAAIEYLGRLDHQV